MKGKKSYELECYALVKNVDKSILKLNPIIKEAGYEFVSFNFAELEQKFASLYSLPKTYQKDYLIKMSEGILISKEFYHAYQNHSLGGSLHPQEEITFFLKRIKNPLQIVIDNIMQIDKMNAGGEMQKFKEDLIRKLKLFKNGDIMSPVQFQISKESRHITTKLTRGIQKPPTTKIYSIVDEEVKDIKEHLNQEFETTELTRIAEMYFNSSYDSFDAKVRFINLITALEALFNRSNNQISHIIARHLSLVISSNKEEFKINFKRIKKLYALRSQIVHGQKVKFKENIGEAIKEVQNLTRIAILYCMKTKMSKEELFDYLNAKGF